MIQSYLHGIDAVTAATRVRKRASILGTRLLPTEIAPLVPVALPANEPPDGVGTLAGMAVGGILWADHRVLGLFLGASLGRNVPAFFRSETRRTAACNLAQTTGGVLGSLTIGGESTAFQVAGFFLGWAAAGAALYYGGVREPSFSATVVGT